MKGTNLKGFWWTMVTMPVRPWSQTKYNLNKQTSKHRAQVIWKSMPLDHKKRQTNIHDVCSEYRHTDKKIVYRNYALLWNNHIIRYYKIWKQLGMVGINRDISYWEHSRKALNSPLQYEMLVSWIFCVKTSYVCQVS